MNIEQKEELMFVILEKYGISEIWREVDENFTVTKVRIGSLVGLETTGVAYLHNHDKDMATEQVGSYIATSRAIMQLINNSINTKRFPLTLNKKEKEFLVSGEILKILKVDLIAYISEKDDFYKRVRLQRQGRTGVKVHKVGLNTFKEIQKQLGEK